MRWHLNKLPAKPLQRTLRGCQVNRYINTLIITEFYTLVRSGWEREEGAVGRSELRIFGGAPEDIITVLLTYFIRIYVNVSL